MVEDASRSGMKNGSDGGGGVGADVRNARKKERIENKRNRR